MKTLLLMAAIAASAFLQSAQPARAQCAERDEAVDYLSDKYQEHPIGIGIAPSGGVLEVFSTADGATWTLVVTGLDGVSCILAEGTDWQAVLPPETGTES